MTLKEFYAAVGGDYADAMGRLMNEKMAKRFLRKFPKDPSYTELSQAMQAADYDTAFRGAHTLKGVAYNLSLTELGDRASALTEALRPGHEEQRIPAELQKLLAAVTAADQAVMAALEELEE